MRLRVIGYVLVTAAVAGSVLAFSLAEDYVPAAGLAYNLSSAELFRTYASATERRQCPTPTWLGEGWAVLPSPRTPIPPGCPSAPEAYLRTPRPTYTTTVTVKASAVPLGTALSATTALALIGVGLLLFGRR